MYIVTTAAKISHKVLESDERNARAAPSKRISIAAGNSTARTVRSIASTASPSDARGPRLKETLTEGNCPT